MYMYERQPSHGRVLAEPRPARDELRMFTLNVSGPSLERAQRLWAYLAGIDADVVVLTETRPNAGTAFLLEAFREEGYAVIAGDIDNPRERGVALAHRLEGTAADSCMGVTLAHRLVVAEVAMPEPVTLIGVYVPSRDATAAKIERKRSFLAEMAQVVNAHASRSDVIVLGDLNVVGRDHNPRYSVFRGWEYEVLDQFERAGMRDAFRELNPGRQVYSWVGRTGDGYRYDYGFLSESLMAALLDCRYVDDARLRRLSDHAGVLMTLRRAAVKPACAGVVA